MRKTKYWSVLKWLGYIAIAFAVLISVRSFFVVPFVVEGASMDPTLQDGEKMVVNKAIYMVGSPDRGDIVIIEDKNDETKHYVKRIVALPGDKVEVVNDRLFINDEEVREPYLIPNRIKANQEGMLLMGDLPSMIVPEGKVFVMGDNRVVSRDSRNGLGLIELSQIVGRTELVYFPLDRLRDVE